jgi:hypothetical protein
MPLPKAKPVHTVWVITLGCLVLYLLKTWPGWLYMATGIGVFGLISPFLARKIDLLWRKLGYVLGLFIPKIILGLLFFLMLTPLAILSRLFRKSDPLSLKKQEESLFQSYDRTVDQSYFEKPW